MPVAGKHFFMKRDCPYVLIILLTPGRYNIENLAGFLTCPESDLPVLVSDSGVRMLSIGMGLTVAGTVPDFHRIPFYTITGSYRITKAVTKIENYLK